MRREWWKSDGGQIKLSICIYRLWLKLYSYSVFRRLHHLLSFFLAFFISFKDSRSLSVCLSVFLTSHSRLSKVGNWSSSTANSADLLRWHCSALSPPRRVFATSIGDALVEPEAQNCVQTSPNEPNERRHFSPQRARALNLISCCEELVTLSGS